MRGVGHSRPINEAILVCRVIGNVHTVASVYWCVLVCTGTWLVENMSWVCMLMGSYSCVCWEYTLTLGGEKCYLVVG